MVARLGSSPLEPIFAAGGSRIPPAFGAQFLHSVDDHSTVLLEGSLHHVWHRPAWLKPLFKFLGRLSILVPEKGTGIPTTLEVRGSRLPDGRPVHLWWRTMHFSTLRHFPTSIIYDPTRKRLIDLVGPGNAIHMVWRAKFTPPTTFTLDSDACGIRVFGKVRWIPRLLWPWFFGTVRFIQRASLTDPERVDIDLVIRHPVLGDVFGYDGTFRVRRHAS